jgi:hypothetical protein
MAGSLRGQATAQVKRRVNAAVSEATRENLLREKQGSHSTRIYAQPTMSQRSMALSLITLLAGVAAGAAMMAGHGASRPPPAATAATAALATPAVARPAAGAQPPSATAWRSVPEVYPVIEGATEADVRNESIDSPGNLGDGP